MANIEELVYNYQNLAGTFMKDKKKSLRNFMKDVQSKMFSETELNALIFAIGSENDREKSFMVDVLMYFKKYERLMSILKQSENPVLIGKILKCWKFFEETFKNINSDELVNDVLPNTSCSTRTKIINRLSKNLKDEKLADDYFKAIEETYGLRTATVLLPACSKDLVENRVTKYHIKLTSRQLMYIVKRRMDFLNFYFDMVHKTDKNFNLSTKYTQVIKYVVKSDVKRFWSLREQHKLHVKFGRNMTTSLLENKKELVKHHENCTDFAKKQIYKIITKNDEDFKEFFLSFYPAKVDEFKSKCLYDNSALTSFLKYVSKPNRYVLMNGYFKNMYGKNLHDDPECATEYSLSIMPENIREVILEKKVLEDEGLVYMFSAKKSIPAIKDRIEHTSDIKPRNKYVSLLYKTCQFNKDDSALLEVLKYLIFRHKNDTHILNYFILKLIHWSHLEKLSGEHWQLINDLLKILDISNNNRRYRYYGLFKLGYMKRYFMHLYESNQPTEEYLEELFKHIVRRCPGLSIFHDNLKYQKLSLERFGVLIQQTLKHFQLNDWSKRFLLSIVQHNEKNTGYDIPILNYINMLVYTKNDLKDDYSIQVVVKYCVRKEIDGYDAIFWENYESLCDYSLVLWYAKNNPYKIIENLHQILSHGFQEKNIDALVFALDARLPNLNIQHEIMKFINQTIQKQNFEKAVCAVRALSHLGKCGDFFNCINSLYPPPDGKIDETDNKKVLLQVCIVKSLTNLKNPSGTLPILLKFCKGDYLKYALAPLYAIANKTRETILSGFLEELYTSAVSVRKHVVTLTKLLLPQQAIYSFLEQQASIVKHPSLKKVIFKNTLEYFIQNPNEMFWNLFLKNMNIITDHDRKSHDALLVKTQKITVEYLPQYVPIIYEKFSKNSDKEIQKKRYAILDFIPHEVIQNFDDDFLKLIIKDTLFNTNVSAEESSFCYKCIFHSTGATQMKLFELVFETFKKYIETNCSTFFYGEVRRTVYNFASKFCLNSIRFKADKKIVVEFIARWSTMFKPEEFIDEYLLLQLTAAYFECDSENFFAEFGPKANEILANMVKRYDSSVALIYSEVVGNFVVEFLTAKKTTEKLLLFVESFVAVNPTRQAYVVVCELLKTYRCSDEYERIIERKQKFQDPVVQMHYKALLTPE